MTASRPSHPLRRLLRLDGGDRVQPPPEVKGAARGSLVAAYRKCSDDERGTAQKDIMSEAYHGAGPSQWIVFGMAHEKEPITAAASRLPWRLLSEETGESWTVLPGPHTESCANLYSSSFLVCHWCRRWDIESGASLSSTL